MPFEAACLVRAQSSTISMWHVSQDFSVNNYNAPPIPLTNLLLTHTLSHCDLEKPQLYIVRMIQGITQSYLTTSL